MSKCFPKSGLPRSKTRLKAFVQTSQEIVFRIAREKIMIGLLSSSELQAKRWIFESIIIEFLGELVRPLWKENSSKYLPKHC